MDSVWNKDIIRNIIEEKRIITVEWFELEYTVDILNRQWKV